MIARSQLQRLLLPIRRFCIRLHRSDKGSGTVVGVALVMVAATLVSVMSGAGHVAVRHAQARSAADLAAFSAALAWRNGRRDPCSLAGAVAEGNNASMVSCHMEGEHMGDVEMSVTMHVDVPLVSKVVASARAGPSACD